MVILLLLFVVVVVVVTNDGNIGCIEGVTDCCWEALRALFLGSVDDSLRFR